MASSIMIVAVPIPLIVGRAQRETIAEAIIFLQALILKFDGFLKFSDLGFCEIERSTKSEHRNHLAVGIPKGNFIS